MGVLWSSSGGGTLSPVYAPRCVWGEAIVFPSSCLWVLQGALDGHPHGPQDLFRALDPFTARAKTTLETSSSSGLLSGKGYSEAKTSSLPSALLSPSLFCLFPSLYRLALVLPTLPLLLCSRFTTWLHPPIPHIPQTGSVLSNGHSHAHSLLPPAPGSPTSHGGCPQVQVE